MPSRNLTETLLKRAVGRDRAEAIVGDLLEMASSRGRLWYYTASLETVLSFTWRYSAAFLIACFGFFTIPYLTNAMLTRPLWLAWGRHSYVSQTLGRTVHDLSFIVLFAALRYGAKDRLFRLALATLVVTGFVYYCFDTPVLVLVLTTSGLLAIAGLLVSAQWRRALLVLALTICIGVLVDLNFGNLAHLGCWIWEHKTLDQRSHYHYFELDYAFPRTIFWIVTWTISLLDALILYFLCSCLHRSLLSSSDAKLA